ncbi:MAG: hypothetical protein RL208_17 [Pseudomonadota bacterium]|jgi:transketolase
MNMQNLSDAIRALSVDMIEKASSGHPGICLGIADILTTIFKNHIHFNPQDPKWPNRDLFILSAGHGSAALYSTLYLAGYGDISLEDLQNFRQLHSKTTGHPEYNLLSGVETTTGPLGQGIANAVGFALGYKILTERFGKEVFNNKIYCLVGDGCLMEGISQEAISFASHYNLDNLIIIFDNNSISIDGKTSLSTSENQTKRFHALNFECYEIDGHSFDEIDNAILKAKKATKPVFISAKTIIGYKSNKENSEKSHGSPLGKEGYEILKNNLSFKSNPFEIPLEIKKKWEDFALKSNEVYNNWQKTYTKHTQKNQIDAILNKKKSFDLQKLNQEFEQILQQKPTEATRKSSGTVLEILTKIHPEIIIGGSADLSHSTNTIHKYSQPISKENYNGNYISYGIREHAMTAISNALSIIGFLPYSSTFLIFADYLKPSLRLSALMNLFNINILTHDSIFLGEDGPTHQPVEHLDSLRLIPNLSLYRPCDLQETIQSYKDILTKQNTSVIALSRQNLPFIQNKYQKPSNGAYIIYSNLANKNGKTCHIIASGSEVQLAIEVAQELSGKMQINAQVMSLYNLEPYNKEQQNLICKFMQEAQIQIAIEASSALTLKQHLDKSKNTLTINVETFGESAKDVDIKHKFGFTVQQIIEKIKQLNTN